MIWLLPSNNNIYDINNAFLELGIIDWKMDRVKFNVGDIVYIYSSIPNQRIMFKCEIIKINVPLSEIMPDAKFWVDESKRRENNFYARFNLLSSYNDDRLGLKTLLRNGLKTPPQGKIKLLNKPELLKYIETISVDCIPLFDDSNFDSRVSRILFCNVAPMKYYQGPEDEALLKGGKYIQEHGVGFELFNFKELDGKFFGFVQPPTGGMKLPNELAGENKHKYAKININKLGATKHDDKIEDITIVWVATHKSRGRSLVGWYKNATVYRTQQEIEDKRRLFEDNQGSENIASYYIVANVDDSILLPMQDREKFKLPKGMGQSNIWYGNNEAVKYVESLIKGYEGFGLYDSEGLKERIDKELENIQEKYKESVLKTRVGQTYFRTSLLNKHNNKCAICGVEGENLLIASHIKAWKDCEKGEHLDENNGLLLCPNHDKVFDKHLITFDESGKILISQSISKNNRLFLNLHDSYRIAVDINKKRYLDFHRERFMTETTNSTRLGSIKYD